ncbi:uncharacterized protein LOC119612076 [Lucilia sericata]|uniref:uncharacterized protein LOC119612076 n=1 Tax=Lucilia sericata TaxID=13632 RepID=UPI0018A80492|nr:uncharacterized protein LOC119612076 [Lucilia sericata]
MKSLYIFMGIFILLLLKDVTNVDTAAVICSEDKPTIDLAERKTDADNSSEEYNVDSKNKEENKNSLNKLFHNIQCTLEKAKPWVAELQQEAKRLEEAAKLLGLGILNSFGEFVDKLVEETAETSTKNPYNSTLSAEDAGNSTVDTANEEISQYLCPEGFIADHNGICERID